MKLKLLQNVMDVILHRLEFDPQKDGDFFITVSLLNQCEDLAFPRSEMRQAWDLHLLPRLGLLRNLGKEKGGDSRGTKCLSRYHSPNVLEQLIHRCFA